LTFPQIATVTTPSMGVQPGDQGTSKSIPAVNVYTVFFSTDGKKLYISRSSDGGKTWILCWSIPQLHRW